MPNREGNRFPIEITRVVDGDGFEARVLDGSGRMIDVRLFAIDAPESEQTYGRASTEYLRQLVQDGRFWLEVRALDSNGRTVGIVHKDSFDYSRTLNYLMVSSGWAYWYSQYEHGEDELGLRAGEVNAYMEGLGVWQNPELERPWDFKERKRQEKETLAEQARQEAAAEQARQEAAAEQARQEAAAEQAPLASAPSRPEPQTEVRQRKFYRTRAQREREYREMARAARRRATSSHNNLHR